MKFRLLLAAAVFSGASAVCRPSAGQAGISAVFTAERFAHPSNGVGSPSTLYGPTFSFYYQSGSFLALGGDVRASFLSGDGIGLDSGALGPRVAVRLRPLPWQIYGEALGGINSYSPGNGSSSSTHVQYELLGGLDATVFPRLDWRVIEYGYTAGTSSLSSNAFSTGLVLRLP